MPYDITVRGPNAPASDHAAVISAFNTFITALRALARGRYVDADGSFADGVKLSADEADTTKTRRFGEVW